jgi:hypothetical protein
VGLVGAGHGWILSVMNAHFLTFPAPRDEAGTKIFSKTADENQLNSR